MSHQARRGLYVPVMAGLSGMSGMAGAGVGLTLAIHDEFTAADGTSVSGRTPAPTNTPGNTWQEIAFGTITNNRYGAFVGGRHQIDCGVADHEVRATLCLRAAQTYMLIARYSDASNYWIGRIVTGSGIAIVERNAAAETVRASDGTVVPATPTEVSAVLSAIGTTLQFTVNGVTISYTSTFNQTATRVGLKGVGGGSDYIDDFKVYV